MIRYQLADTARKELTEILSFVAEQSGWAPASALADDFDRAFERLTDAPNAGAVRAHTASHRRWWRVHNYLILYRLDGDVLTVLRIIHGARNLPDIDL